MAEPTPKSYLAFIEALKDTGYVPAAFEHCGPELQAAWKAVDRALQVPARFPETALDVAWAAHDAGIDLDDLADCAEMVNNEVNS